MIPGEEETIIEYARFHGLASEGLDPLSSSLAALRDSCESPLSDDAGLAQIHFQPPSITDERLTVDKDAARLLAGANTSLLDSKDTIPAALSDNRRKKSKLELPLLRSDPDSDFASFKAQTFEEAKDAYLPFEPIDEENDGGVLWPSRLTNLPSDLITKCTSEKIKVLKETLLYMQTALTNNWTEEDQKASICNELSYNKVGSDIPLAGHG